MQARAENIDLLVGAPLRVEGVIDQHHCAAERSQRPGRERDSHRATASGRHEAARIALVNSREGLREVLRIADGQEIQPLIAGIVHGHGLGAAGRAESRRGKVHVGPSRVIQPRHIGAGVDRVVDLSAWVQDDRLNSKHIVGQGVHRGVAAGGHDLLQRITSKIGDEYVAVSVQGYAPRHIEGAVEYLHGGIAGRRNLIHGAM